MGYVANAYSGTCHLAQTRNYAGPNRRGSGEREAGVGVELEGGASEEAESGAGEEAGAGVGQGAQAGAGAGAAAGVAQFAFGFH